MYPPLEGLKKQEIIERLKASYNGSVDCPYPPGFIRGPKRPAAVLIPMLLINSSWHLLFIHRTHHIDDPHSGQVAFPGGARDPNDQHFVSTALRETYEELGIEPSDVEVLGQLNDFVTITGYQVTPVVGLIPWPYRFRVAQNEVNRFFTIPLDWLADPSNHVIQERSLPEPYPSIPVIYFNMYDGEVLWGASARFALSLIGVLTDNPMGKK